MSYSSRSSFFLKIKSITQNQSSSFIKKIIGFFFILIAIAILWVPIINKKLQILENILDKNLSYIYEKTAAFNAGIKQSKESFLSIFSLISENKRLKLENEKLKVIENKFFLTKLENEKLKSINKFTFPKTKKILATRLIFRSDGQVGMAKILVGKINGIKTGQFVVTTTGVLLGKIIHASDKTAKILLINEPKSKISVTFPRIMNRAILSGNSNNDGLDIVFTKTNEMPKHGDLVVTSGDDGYLPAGLIVGTVISSKYGKKFVAPMANPDNVEFVSVLELENIN